MTITCKDCGKSARVSRYNNRGICNPCAKARDAKRKAQAAEIVKTGHCPECGRELRRNLSLTGWYQCSQFGAEGFRADASLPACGFQIFA